MAVSVNDFFPRLTMFQIEKNAIIAALSFLNLIKYVDISGTVIILWLHAIHICAVSCENKYCNIEFLVL
jgi:hypothetical protein